jgi:hypothetical protein
VTRGEWLESDPAFELVPGSARAWKGPHRVTLAANPNLPGAVQHRLPDGRLLASHVVGIGWYDTATGESVLIAGLQDSTGIQVSPSVIVYPDALQGDAPADLRYTYSQSSLEQDVILRASPPPASAYGLSDRTSRLEVWTEFDEGLDPQVTSVKHSYSPDEPQSAQANSVKGDGTQPSEDVLLDFGSIRIGTGQAFALGAESESLGLMVKEWIREVDGRRFLVEALPALAAIKALNDLPPGQGGADWRPATRRRRETLWAGLPRPAGRPGGSLHRLDPVRDTALVRRLGGRGLVMDYLAITGGLTNYTFRGDTNYWVTSAVLLDGLTTFEPGSVIKFDVGSTAGLVVRGTLAWKATPLLPVTLTARDDTGFGETVPGQTTPLLAAGYGGAGLRMNGPATTTISGLRVRNLRRGIEYASGTGHQVRHAQFVDCGEAVRLSAGTSVTVRNGLVSRAQAAVWGGTGSATALAEHLTVNGATRLAVAGVFPNAAALTLRNSLLVSVTNSPSGTYTGGVDTALIASPPADLFLTLRGGAHYLPEFSPHREVGTASVEAGLTAELREMTTEAPQELAGDIVFSTVLRPVARPDTGVLDRGYHYPRIDYAASGVTLTNATLTLTNGVRLGAYGAAGINLRQGAILRSGGTPQRLNWLTRLATFQENPTAEPTTAAVVSSLGGSPVPRLELRFTGLGAAGESLSRRQLVAASGNGVVNWTLRDCELWNVRYATWATASGHTLNWHNNLWIRGNADFYLPNLGGYLAYPVSAYHNLWWGGAVKLDAGQSGPWTWRDNLFDGSANQVVGTSGISATYNGYRGSTALGAGNNRTLTTTDFQTGPLGPWYYPLTGTNLATLLDVGSRTAALAGLYHHTVRVDRAKELGGTVDLGFHVVASDAAGVATDQDGDGLPDWLEDENGDGSVTGDVSPWNAYTSVNGLGAGSLVLFTPLKP